MNEEKPKAKKKAYVVIEFCNARWGLSFPTYIEKKEKFCIEFGLVLHLISNLWQIQL